MMFGAFEAGRREIWVWGKAAKRELEDVKSQRDRLFDLALESTGATKQIARQLPDRRGDR